MEQTKTYGLTHLAIGVSDLSCTRDFYQAVFGMVLMYETEQMIQLTTPGCNDILVFEKKNDLANGHTGGIAHFGFRLRDAKDIDDLHEKIMKAGGTIIEKSEFVPGAPYLYFKDPDNYTVEIWYELITGK
ncbi:MAG: hypothetical protein K0S53_3049 [Bacteroidetes bacterium]|jgi:catechol 2,3-dioxygenase-like lactoylglutathione lyase family enzyme|nr:hypothetical protein [Bacteroidota bacterium]MDF2452938.1 hypothetical protein [Bacteroidota bacterium]